ncbi:flagellar basal body P-ring formation chaperone FlgA [Marinimicrobium sp. C6131]|uniref:flagellar basal body P-ring formation chaperone FlgA n=1 Tax=Marinimicrobium sp. C6131 TaxID=3022676 RepID=UPI00223CF4DC|nr:flagellar basal body P-ring formation chaperone FlgA [Marinimicrobium sp. C6131]UZJ45697.1 flagellar basal body P-ring formation chaperone FlgA [Marinimicrobium sp. C6131]
MGPCRLFNSLTGRLPRGAGLFCRRLAGALILFLLTSASLARPETPHQQDLDQLRADVKQYLQAHYRIPQIKQARVTVGRLDSRLRLKACEAPLALSVNDEERSGGNLTVHTRCPGPTAWALYVPAEVAVYREVAVASRSLGRGHRISPSDMTMELRDTGQLRQGFVVDADSALGKELRRPLKAGEPIRLGLLTEPTVVERGDQVRLRAQTGNISVDTMGTALSSGRVGDQIRVRNDRSERIVRGRVTGPGSVEVIL